MGKKLSQTHTLNHPVAERDVGVCDIRSDACTMEKFLAKQAIQGST